jgi:signal transduction histidine kinase
VRSLLAANEGMSLASPRRQTPVVDQSTVSAVAIDAALDQIVGTAAQLVDSSVAGVFLLDADGQWFDLVAGRGFQPDKAGARLARDASVAGTVIRSRQPVKIGDVREAPLAALPKLINSRAAGSLVVTPIVSSTGPLGVIEAYSPRLNAFSDGHTTLLGTLATAAGMALDNARLNASERLARVEVQRLQSLTQQLGRSLSSDEVLDHVAAMAAELLESSVVGVYLLDSRGDGFNLVASRGIDPSGHAQRLPKTGSLAGRAITSGEPINIGDVRTSPPTTLPRLISGQAIGSLIVAPINSAEGPLGVIEVYDTTVNAFSARHAELLSTLAAAAATTIENARLYSAEQQARREAQRLQALTGRLGRSLSAEDVLDQIAAIAAELIDSPVAGVFLLDDVGQHFDLVAGRGLDLRAGVRLPRDGSLASRVITSGKAVAVPDVSAAEVTALPQLVSGEAVGSLVVAPIISPHGPLGVVEVYSTSVGAFGRHDAELLAGMAGAAAAVLENARLYRAREQDLTQLRTIMERLPVGVVVAEAPSGQIIVKNRLAEELFGITLWPEFQAGRKDPRRGTHRRGQPYLSDEWPLARALLHGEVVSSERIEIERDGGELTTLNVSAAPISDPSGKIVAAVAVYDDVSNEVALQRQRDHFLSAAAHDMKTPLTSIRGLVQLLQRQLGRADVPRERIVYTLRGIESGTRKMTGLIDELLDISRLETVGELSLSRRDIDLVELTRRVVDDQGGQERTITLDADPDSISGHWDEARLERAIGNLLGNAIKYSPRGGEIKVTVREQEIGGQKWAVLSVADHGIGVPAGDVERIFERFTRGSNVPERLAGSGIGLSYVRQVVGQHGGSVSVQSQPGAGSTFSLRLPEQAD